MACQPRRTSFGRSWFGYGSVFSKQQRMLIPVANEPSQALHLGLSELDKLRAVVPAAGRAFWQLAMRGDAAYVARPYLTS
jgi:hypothetical protein